MRTRQLLIVVVVCLLLYAGTAEASETAEIRLDHDCVSQSDEDLIELTGEIVDEDAKRISNHFRLSVYAAAEDIGSGEPLYTGFALNGAIELQLPGDLAPGDYYLVAEDLEEEYVVTAATFYVTVGLSTEDELSFTWGERDELFFTGKLVQEPGQYEEIVLVLDRQQVIASTRVTASGAFALYVDIKDEVIITGKLELFAAEDPTGLTPGTEVTSAMLEGLVKITEGEISPGEVAIQIKPGEAFYGLDNKLVFSVDKESMHGFSSEAGMNFVSKFEWVLEHDDETIVIPVRYGEAFSADDMLVSFDGIDQPRFMSEDRGTWQVTLNVLGANGKPLYTGTASFEVKRPAAVNLVGLRESITVAEGYQFEVGKDVKIARFMNDELTDFADTFIISVSGAGLEPIENRAYPYVDAEGELVRVVNLRPTKAGTIELEITGKRGEETIGTFRRTIRVEGASAELNVHQLEVDSEGYIKVTVRDEDGQPVNNAYIEFVNCTTGSVDYRINKSGRENIVGGIYLLEVESDTFDRAAEYEVVVRSHSDDSIISYGGILSITGKRVYSVTVEPGVLLAGERESVLVKVSDSKGQPVVPDSIVFETANECIEFSRADILRSRVDLNDDRDYDAIALEVPAFLQAGEGTITVQTDYGTRMGSTGFEVVAPRLKLLNDAEAVTDRYYELLEFCIIDPRSGETLDWDVTVTVEYAELLDAEQDGISLTGYIDEEQSVTLYGDSSYALEVLTAVSWHNLAEDEAPQLVFSAEGIEVSGSLPIRPASLAAEPDQIVLGQPVEVTVILVSANGRPLAGYRIYADNVPYAETDQNGQVIYRTTATTYNPVVLEAENDCQGIVNDDEQTGMVSKALYPGVDREEPTVEAPATVNTDHAEIIIRDNVRIGRVAINNEEMAIFPRNEVRIRVPLEPGINKIRIQAMDVNYNTLDTTVTITYSKESAPGDDTGGDDTGNSYAEIQLGVDTGFGAPELQGNTTMVPVRVAQKMLGATMEWDPQERAVTYSLGDVTIVAREGSNVVEVNGVKTAVPVAPYIKDNRLYVPLRLIAQELGFSVKWQGHDKPIIISK